MSTRSADTSTTPPTSLADVLEIQREAIRLLRQGHGRLQSGAWASASDAIRSALRRVEELAKL
jgi:hypothetical protein